MFRRKQMSDSASQAAHDAIDRIADHVASAEHRMRDSADRALGTSNRYLERATERTGGHPFVTAAVAFAVGFVLCAILRR